MKKGLLHIFLSFLLFCFFAQCDKEVEKTMVTAPSCANQIDEIIQASALIVGDWTWVLTYKIVRGQASPQIETPKTNGSKMLAFNTNNTVEFIENNTLKEIKQYSIDKSSDSSLYIYFLKTVDNTVDRANLKLCSDTLILDYSFNDSGGKELYVRK